MATGKLYQPKSKIIVNINYKLFNNSEKSWSGELVPEEYRRIENGDGYIIELEDGRQGRCYLRKLVNRAVSGIPPLYHYHFRGYPVSEQAED